MSQYHKRPEIFNDKSETEKCAALALSMFNSLGNCKASFKYQQSKMGRKAYERLGNKISVGHLKSDHGVNESPNGFGHFNHHPAQNSDYVSIFKITDEGL